MKRLLALLLALIMCLSLCACAGTGDDRNSDKDRDRTSRHDDDVDEEEDEEEEETVGPTEQPEETTESVIEEPESWTAEVTRDGNVLFTGYFTGTYDDSSGKDGELAGAVYMMADPTGNHYTVSFRLLEDGDSLVSYTSADVEDMTLKTRVSGEEAEFELYGVEPDGDLYLGLDDGTQADYFVENLYLGYNIKCTIHIGDAAYDFKVESDGFDQLFEDSYGIHSSEDALDVFVNSDHRIAGVVYLTYHMDELHLMETDELVAALPGYWYSEDMRSNAYAQIYHYSEDGKQTHIAEIAGSVYRESNDDPQEYWVEDDVLFTENGAMFMFFRITKGYYMVIYHSIWGVDYMYLYAQCSEEGIFTYQIP